MSCKSPIIQWNMNGFFNNFEELKLLTSHQNPYIICLQETHLKIHQRATYNGYQMYRKDFSTVSDRAKGGVCTLVKSNFSSELVQLDSNLQAVAVRVQFPMNFTLCNIYFPPNDHIKYADVFNLVQQLPKPFILGGDFNAHSILWGSNHTSTRGRIIERILEDFDINLMNDGSKTHFTVSSCTESAIDLTFCTPYLSISFSWEVHDELYGSDHYPIIMHHNLSHTSDSSRPRWKVDTADWSKFATLLEFVMRS